MFNQVSLSHQQTNPKTVDTSEYGTVDSSTSTSADDEGQVTQKKYVEPVTPADCSGMRNFGKDCALTANTVDKCITYLGKD